MSIIDDALADGKRQLAAHEARMVDALLTQYDVAWQRIERELLTLELHLQQAIRSGDPISEQWLRRQRWWREVQDSIEREMAVWSGDANRVMATLQSGGVTIAADVTGTIARAAGNPFQGRVYAQAFERWVSAIQPGSPLRTVIDGYGDRVTESALKRMTEGIGSGQNNRTILRAIGRDVKPENVTPNMLTMVRTETMRSYRGASSDAYVGLQQRGIITSYRWLAAKSIRTCIACIAMDGQIFDHYPMTQHVNCRCTVRPVVDPKYVPGSDGRRESAADWLAKQDEKTQKRILMTPGRFKAYQDGVAPLEMVTMRSNPVWGESVAIKPMSQIVRGR